MNASQIQVLGLNTIKPSAWNSRVEREGDAERLQSLADSIKKQGQQSPIQVMGPDDDGGYHVVFGNRRLAACALAGLTTVRAEVVSMMDEGSARVRNALENTVRQDLTTYEMARVCAELRQQKLSLKEIGSMVGLSFQSVSNHVSCYDKLHADIRAEWAKGDPAATINTLRPIATLKGDEAQLKAWDNAVLKRTAADRILSTKEEPAEKSVKGEDNEGGGSTPIRASAKRLTEIIDLSVSRKLAANYVFRNKDGTGGTCSKEWLRSLVQWLCAQTEKRPAGFPSEETEETEE